MFTRILVSILILTSGAMGRQSGTNRISAGDPLSRVHEQLGTARVEYPLNGKLIQEYKFCTITSRDGVVVSVVYREGAEPVEKQVEKKKAPTFEAIKAKAMQGDAEAQYLLGYCYQSGQAVKQNSATAVKWYTKAAMQGHMPAQHNLGVMYMTGKGVERDYEEAYAWALLAAANGNDDLAKALRRNLSEEESLAGAQRAKKLQSELRARKAASTKKEETKVGHSPAPDAG